jgi:hypothetical protein
VGKEEGDLFHLLEVPVSVKSSLSNSVVHDLSKYVANTCSVLSNNDVSYGNVDHSVDTSLWHYRLGHLFDRPLKILSHVLPHFNHDSNKACTVCPLAKQHRLPFQHSDHISQHPFDLIHCDIWGPFSTKSVNGSAYFFTIVDDHFRFTWVHLMQHKFQTRTHIQNFFSMITNQVDSKIKCIRSDNGVEFNMTEFYSSQGTLHQLSCVETPQQNSVVERKHQHILNVARSLRFQSHIPLSFWSDCILTAVHLINRIPAPVLHNKSPFEVLFSVQPSYSHLKVFGCLCYANTLTRSRHKFDARAKPCVFLGYPVGVKGYKLYDLISKSFFISRDVQFHETIFPFALSHSEPIHSPSPDLVLPLPSSDFAPSSLVSDISSSSIPPNFFVPISSSPSPISHPPEPARKSSRLKNRPGYLQDYHCHLATSSGSPSGLSPSSGILYDITSFLSYNKLSSNHKHFSLSISSIVEPTYYHQAVQHAEWRDAMHNEIQALELNNTWTVVDLPPSKQAIGCKWVYKVKLKSDGTIERYKA